MPNAGFTLPANKNNEAKIGLVAFAENIVVGDKAPSMETFCALMNFAQFIDGKVSFRNSTMESFLLGSNCSDAAGGTDQIRDRIIESYWDCWRDKTDKRRNTNVARWCKPIVAYSGPEFELQPAFLVLPYVVSRLDGDISSQLSRGGFIRPSNETNGSPPQHQRNDRKQPLAGLDTQDRDFRSVLAAALVLLFATWIYLRGWAILGWAAAAYPIFGLMLRLDFWSLAIGIF